MHQAHDLFATRMWQVLLEQFRTTRTHVTIELPALEADFWADPGPPLPDWMGLLARIAGRRLLIGESETGYLTVDEVLKARLELDAAWRLRQQTLRRTPPAGQGLLEKVHDPGATLLLFAEQATRAVVREALGGPQLTELEPGLWHYPETFPVYIISLSDLEFCDDTAVVHLLGRGPKLPQALRWLALHPDNVVARFAGQIQQEVKSMSSSSAVSWEDIPQAEREAYLEPLERVLDNALSLRARRRAELRGEQKGKLEGRLEEARAVCTRVWLRKFGALEPWLTECLNGPVSLAVLEAITEDLAVAKDRGEAEALVRSRF